MNYYQILKNNKKFFQKEGNLLGISDGDTENLYLYNNKIYKGYSQYIYKPGETITINSNSNTTIFNYNCNNKLCFDCIFYLYINPENRIMSKLFIKIYTNDELIDEFTVYTYQVVVNSILRLIKLYKYVNNISIKVSASDENTFSYHCFNIISFEND